MKVYVDQKPKCCWDCPCFRQELEQPCGLDLEDKGYYLDEIDGGKCPLKLMPKEQVSNVVETKFKIGQKVFGACEDGIFSFNVEKISIYIRRNKVVVLYKGQRLLSEEENTFSNWEEAEKFMNGKINMNME